MNVRQPGMEKSRRIYDLHDLRLKTLLDDLVGDNAASRSTADLDVGPRTLAAQPGERKADPADAGGAGPDTAGWGMRRK